MAIKDLAELIKKFTQKDKFKPTTVQVIRAAKNPPVPAQNEDISVPSEGERIHFLNTGRSDCILLQSESKFALVDCGDAEHAKHTARYLKETASGKINLDFIAITHLHPPDCGDPRACEGGRLPPPACKRRAAIKAAAPESI